MVRDYDLGGFRGQWWRLEDVLLDWVTKLDDGQWVVDQWGDVVRRVF